MPVQLSRRDVLQLMSVGGVVFASGLAGAAGEPGKQGKRQKKSSTDADFFFLQLSDTHWGYSGPANPQADVTLKRVVDTINGVAARPDFIVFTGDLTHTTDDAAVRRKRMTEFKQIVAHLKVKTLHLMPGEHDAALDAGRAFEQTFGATRYAFDHKGVHFIALDNVSDATGAVGDAQIDWLSADLKRVGHDAPIVLLTHRPLFDLAPSWDWSTRDGAKVIDVLLPYKHVTVFYGHIHQEHHHQTEHIRHHAARSLVFPLPAPGSVVKKAPLPWDPAAPFAGLGYRQIDLEGDGDPRLTEIPVVKTPA
jgi:Calcineurin-like phosphoesterase